MSELAGRVKSVRRYVFFDEHRPSRAWMPTLEMINDRYCQYLRTALLHHLPAGVEVSPPVAIQLIRHSELMERFATPSHLTLVNLKPLRGTILIAVDAQLVSWIVESRFGGNGRFALPTPNREFTPFEQKCMRPIEDTALQQLALAWKPIAALVPQILRHEVNPQFAAIATAGELIIVNALDVKIGSGGGKLTICIPYAMLEPLHDQLVTGTVQRAVDHDLRWRESLAIGIGEAMMTLSVELAELEMTVGELLELQPGAVFEIERPENVTVEANGFPLFRGQWGKLGRRVGVKIEERLISPADVPIPATSKGRSDLGSEQR
jgi:flagellar motor switch protein FliM